MNYKNNAIHAGGSAWDDSIDQTMTDFRAALARMDSNPAEAARIRALACQRRPDSSRTTAMTALTSTVSAGSSASTLRATATRDGFTFRRKPHSFTRLR